MTDRDEGRSGGTPPCRPREDDGGSGPPGDGPPADRSGRPALPPGDRDRRFPALPARGRRPALPARVRRPALPADDRAVTPILAVVVVVGLVAVASVGILLLGAGATDRARDDAETDRMETAFRSLDARIDDVGRSGEGSATVNLDLPEDSGGAVREASTGRIVINRTNVTAGGEETLVNRSLGAIVYRHEGTTLALQGGGVWRGTGNDSTMVSAPAFSYATTTRNTQPTLTVPLIETSGDRRLTGGQVRLSSNGTVSPLTDVTVVEGELVVVRVRSDYYVAWGEYFEQVVDERAVRYDHANETTVLRMVVPIEGPAVQGGVIVGAASETLRLKQYATVDSYDSSVGGYPATASDETRVLAAGDVNLKQHATVEGTLEVGGEVNFGQDSRVTGGLAHSGDYSFSGPSSTLSAHVDDWTNDNASVTPRNAVDGVIDRNVGLIREENDNATAANVSGGRLQGCDTGPGCELAAGAYLLDRIDLDDDDRLVLNTTDGSIDLAVRNDVSLYDADVDVVGDGRVNLYVDGETGSEDFAMKQDASVTVPGDDAPRFWVYMDAEAEAKLRQSADFTGVIYGPGGGTAGTHVTMSSTSDEIHVYGAVVGDVEPITQEVNVHYDQDLATAEAVRTAIAVPRLTFLHVSVHRVDVEDG